MDTLTYNYMNGFIIMRFLCSKVFFFSLTFFKLLTKAFFPIDDIVLFSVKWF